MIDDSATLWTVPADLAAATGAPLLVLLHGYGSDERDLPAIAGYLPDGLAAVSLPGPLRAGPGRAWFPITTPGDPDPIGVTAGADAVLTWLDEAQQAQPGLGASGIVPVGFSQGGAIALQLLRRAPERFRAAVNLSGFVASGTEEADAVLAESKPPVFWGRGDADPVIGPVAVERTAAWLPAHTTPAVHVFPGLAHEIAAEELAALSTFLHGIFPSQLTD